MKKFRRSLACLLAVLMVVCSMPISALAFDGELPVGWWGDADYDATTNPNIPRGEQSFNGWNSEAYEMGFEFGDRFDPIEFEMTEEASAMLDEYKPVLTVTVSDQGTAENPIYRQFYGYSENFDYDTVEAAGHILNPADLKAGQRIAVTFEIGGIDAIATGLLKGIWDADALNAGYYMTKTNWKSYDNNTQSASSALLVKGHQKYYASAISSGVMAFDNKYHQIAYEWSSADISDIVSNYCGDRPFGKNGMVICVLSFEVLKDCNLKEVLHLNTDKEGTRAYSCTYFSPYVPDAVGDKRFTFDTVDTKYTYGLLALDYSNYEEGTPAQHEHTYTSVVTPPTCTEAGYTTWTCGNEDGLCDNVTYTDTPVKAKGHTYGDVSYDWATDFSKCTATKSCVEGDDTITQTVNATLVSDSASCGAAGVKTYKAEFTKENLVGTATTTDASAATGNHTYGDVSYDWAADNSTCTATKSCADCDATITQTVDATVVSDTATCGAAGVKTYEAVFTTEGVAGKATTTAPSAATGNHTYGDVSYDWAADNSACTATKSCADCDAVITQTVGATVVSDTATCGADGVKTIEAVFTTEGVAGKATTTAPSAATGNHAWVNDAAVPATQKTPGVEAGRTCSECQTKEGYAPIAALGVNITVDAATLGTVTIDGADAAGTVKNVPYDTNVTLVATPNNDNIKFIGWVANGANVVSNEATFTVKATADVTYTAVFAETTDSAFTVTFVDMFNNVIKQQEVNDASEIVAPTAPEFVGYTFAKWSVDPATVTETTTIVARYDKNNNEDFTVTAPNCTITDEFGKSEENAMAGVTYNTSVTVTAPGATSWEINGATVAYGESYTFFVGCSLTVTPVFGDPDTVTATPTVSKVSMDRVSGNCDVIFLATRSMANDCTFVNAGFVYGKNLNDADLCLEMVGKTGTGNDSGKVKAVYVATEAEQFSLRYGVTAQQGTASACAFLIYIDAEGDTQVIYALPQVYPY